MKVSDLYRWHRQSSYHRERIFGQSAIAYVSCFYCCRQYPAHKVKEWIDDGQTAICPLCGIDAVIPVHMGDEALKEMHDHWFCRTRRMRMPGDKKRYMNSSLQRIKVTLEENDEVDLNDLCYEAHEMAREKGFWDDTPEEPGRLTSVGAKVALIHSEVSEALEEYRNGAHLDEVRIEDGKPEGFGVELADAVIRIADIAQHAGVNLGALVKLKMRYNKSRGTRHGNKRI